MALAAGCGSSGTHSVRDVERAFAEAGLPFEQELLRNPYLRRSNVDFVLPGRARPLSRHVTAVLGASSASKFTLQLAYVFDSPRSAEDAVRGRPLSGWLDTDRSSIRARVDNVVVIAEGDARTQRRVRRAMDALRR